MSAEELVAAAAAATGPIIDGDVAGWTERLRQTASAAVVVAADMARLFDALSDPDCKTFVRVVKSVERDKGGFLVTYDPPTEYTYRGELHRNDNIRTGWADEPAVIALARTARSAVGQRAVFFQRNELPKEGDTEAPAAGYRRLWHIEPLPTAAKRPQPAPPAESAPPPVAATAPAPAATPNGNGNGHHPEPDAQPEPEPAVEAEAEAGQQSLDDAPPTAADPRPMDKPFLSNVVRLLGEDVDRDTATLQPAVVAAFRQWWNDLGSPGQAKLRAANTAAKRDGNPHVTSIHNPVTVAQLKTVGRLTRCLAEPVPA